MRRPGLALLGALLALLALAPAASAAYQRPLEEVFGSAQQPALAGPSMLAVAPGGDLLVGDRGRNETQRIAFSSFADGDKFTLANLPAACSASVTEPIEYVSSPEATLSASVKAKLEEKCGGAGFVVYGSASVGIKVVFGGAYGLAPQQLMSCAASSGGGSCAVERYEAGAPRGIFRFKPNGEPDPFSGLGTNLIDGGEGPGKKSCDEEPASCDKTPQNALVIDSGGQIAVSPTNGDIYVTQYVSSFSGPFFVDIFSSEGKYLGQLSKAGIKTFGGIRGIAIDPAGAVYVAVGGEINKFVPSANPPLNTDNTDNFKIAGYELGQMALGAGPSAEQIFISVRNNGTPSVLEVNKETGEFHVFSQGLGSGKGYGGSAITVDPTTGNPVVANLSNQLEAAEFDGSEEVAGPVLSRLLFGHGLSGIADFGVGSTGQIYGAANSVDPRIFVYGPPAVVPTVSVGAPSEITTSEARLSGTISPEGLEADECNFEVLSAVEAETQGSERQKIAFTGATGGTFTLTFKGQTTEAIPYGASGARVTAALEGISTVGAGNVNVSVGSSGAYSPQLTFIGSLENTNVPQLEADASGLTPGGSTVEVTTTKQGSGWGSATLVPCEGEIPPDSQAHAVEGSVSGLLPNGVEYAVRLAATNENGTERSAVLDFATAHTAATRPATVTGRTTATLNGTIRPEGLQYTECFFEWGLASNPGYEHTAECDPAAATIPADHETHAVSADLSGLSEGAEYRFRLVATGPEGTQHAEELTFETFGPPRIRALRASGASQSSATLEAEIDPHGLDTSYRFEWGPTESYGHSAPASFEALGSGTEAVRATAQIAGLSAATAYHYRVVAGNEADTVESADQVLETLNSCGLPEGRCLELVSPKDLGPVAAPGRAVTEGVPFQASTAPGGLAYQIDLGLPGGTSGGVPTYFATRGANGWSSAQVNPAITEPIETANYTAPSTVDAVSPDLSCAILTSSQPLTDDPVARLAVEAGSANLYRRNPDGSYTLITDLPPEGHLTSSRPSDQYRVVGMSGDCGRVVFETQHEYAGVPTVPAPSVEEQRLYEWDEGALRSVGWVPQSGGGEAAAGATAGQYSAVADDGSRVFFSASRLTGKVSGEAGKAGVFVRIGGSTTLDVSASETAAPDTGATYQGATPDGSSVYFLANAGLTAVSNPSGTDLYECRIVESGGGEPECELTDISVDPAGGPAEAGELVGSLLAGLVGVADDGSRAYFAAQGQLDPDHGPTLAENKAAKTYSLYEYERSADEVHFIGSLTKDNLQSAVVLGGYPRSTVSPNGRYLLFESSTNLTGYDSGGLPEAYLYDAEADEEAVTCVSCRQNGQPSLNPGGANTAPLWSRSLALRNGKPLAFFISRDGLAPGPEGESLEGEWALYEWSHGQVFHIATNKPGTAPPKEGGLVRFLDTNADATDLYFADPVALNWENPEGRNAIWDARVGGGFPEPPPPSEPCDAATEGPCQGPAATPPVTPGAGSATFNGAGNLKPKPHKKAKHKKKRRKKRHKKDRKQKRGTRHANANRRAGR